MVSKLFKTICVTSNSFFFLNIKNENQLLPNREQFFLSPNICKVFLLAHFSQPVRIIRLKIIKPAALLENARQPHIFQENRVYFMLGSIV